MAHPERSRVRLPWWTEPLVLTVLAAVLVLPFFRLTYPAHWNREDGARIADIHYLRGHWPRPGWQPYWFGGIRFDAIYPPGLRYAGALAARIRDSGLDPAASARAYWRTIAFGVVVGSAGFWLLALLLTRSRGAALWAGLASLLLSPCVLFLPDVRADIKAPFRVDVSARYGDGPHVAALGFALFALAAAYRSFFSSSRRAAIPAGLAAALVVATDWHATYTLGFLLFWLCYSDWLERQRPESWRRAGIIAALAVLLNAWWLTPDLWSTATGAAWRAVTKSNLWTPWFAVAAVLTLLLLSERCARGRRNSAAIVFAAAASVYYVFDVVTGFFTAFVPGDIVSRFIPEMDLSLILAATLLGRLCWLSTMRKGARAAIASAAVLSLAFGLSYLRHPWRTFPLSVEAETSPVRVASHTLAERGVGKRFLLAGRLEGWNLLWSPTAQLGGGLDPSTLDVGIGAAYLRSLQNPAAGYGEKWWRIFAVDGVVIPAGSEESDFGVFRAREEFRARYRAESGGDPRFLVLAGPPREKGLADVVRVRDLAGVSDEGLLRDEAILDAYGRALSQGTKTTAKAEWRGPNEIHVEGRLAAGEAFWLDVRYDPGWEAYVGLNPARLHRAPAGLMWVEAPEGEQKVRFYYHPPFAQRAGLLVTVLSATGVVASLFLRGRGGRRR